MTQSKDMEFPQEIPVKVTKSADYQIRPASGAWISPTPTGMIKLDLYIEYRSSPESLVLRFLDATSQPEEIRQSESIIREIVAGVLLSPSAAVSISKVLADKANELTGIIQSASGAGSQDAE